VTEKQVDVSLRPRGGGIVLHGFGTCNLQIVQERAAKVRDWAPPKWRIEDEE
jgi:lipoate-protein ligase A